MKLNASKKTSPFKHGKVYSSELKVNSKYATLKLPRSVADYLKLQGKTVYWTAINDAVQISANQPTFFIPAMKLDVGAFTPNND